MQKIVPAILTKDVEDLQAKLKVLQGLTEWVQIDIMDGKFVPNTSIAITELADASAAFSFEIHLMVKNPEQYLADCKAVGAKRVIFHLEGAQNPREVLEKMEGYGFEKGIALNPETSVDVLSALKGRFDSVLFLTVIPGAQGHEFIPSVLEKVKRARELFSEIRIGVDGGVKEGNIREVLESGVDYAVIGSGIWKTDNPKETLLRLQSMVQ